MAARIGIGCRSGSSAARGSALIVTLMSYNGTCCVGVNIDTGAVPDPDVMMDCLRDGFDDADQLCMPGD
jgi:WS/DGAT C-terminal domain